MGLRVHVLCQNPAADRILPRMARALRDICGWTLDPARFDGAQALYLSGYFEGQRLKPWPKVPVAGYFTHREEEPGSDKARCFDEMAAKVQLRVATCKIYADVLAKYGPTVQASAPLERKRFALARRAHPPRPVIGFSGYTYRNHRKGEDLVRGLLTSPLAKRVQWRACGRGWPAPLVVERLAWAQMPAFYQSLDVLVIPSRVEGIPMPPLEALACGVSVVVPWGVGLLDELPEVRGIYRYARGNLKELLLAVEQAAFPSKWPNPEKLRAATAAYSIEQWAHDNERAVAQMLGGA